MAPTGWFDKTDSGLGFQKFAPTHENLWLSNTIDPHYNDLLLWLSVGQKVIPKTHSLIANQSLREKGAA